MNAVIARRRWPTKQSSNFHWIATPLRGSMTAFFLHGTPHLLMFFTDNLALASSRPHAASMDPRDEREDDG